MFDLPCVILAGGQSSRMGQDKSCLTFDTYPTLLEYQYQRLSKLFVTTLISSKQQRLPNTPHIHDKIANISAPLIALVSLFEVLDSDLFIIGVDMPFVTQKQIMKLFEARENGVDIVVARTASHTHPLCAIYSPTIKPKLDLMYKQGNYKLIELLNIVTTKYIDFDKEEAFININYYHQYQKAVEMISSSYGVK